MRWLVLYIVGLVYEPSSVGKKNVEDWKAELAIIVSNLKQDGE